MKKLVSILTLMSLIIGAVAQDSQENFIGNGNKNTTTDLQLASPVFSTENTDFIYSSNTRGQVSEWWDFNAAFSQLITNKKNIYTLLYPDTIKALYSDATNPGQYTVDRVRTHSVGVAFAPYSYVFLTGGSYFEFKKNQPYKVDSIAILYNYNRYTDNSVVDTLVVNVFNKDKLLYYKNSTTDAPAGASVGYDLSQNKGRNYTQEIKIPLTITDTITYNYGKKKGVIYVPLSNFNVTSNIYGAVIGMTFSFVPGSSYTINDTLDGDFIPTLPHSQLNHFFFWNFIDYEKQALTEFNNGLFIFSWTDKTPKYKNETSNGNLYWRGSSFSNRNCYPAVQFKITYSDNWVGIDNPETGHFINVYPNPASDVLFVESNIDKNLKIDLINGVGQIVKSFDAVKSNTRLDIKGVERGLYFVKLINGEETQTIKLMIQ